MPTQQPYTLPSRAKSRHTNQNLSKSMAVPTRTEEKSQCTTFCIVHSGLSADFEHYHSPVFWCCFESEISLNPLRHHTIYRCSTFKRTEWK
jgi:hypothetical protein